MSQLLATCPLHPPPGPERLHAPQAAPPTAPGQPTPEEPPPSAARRRQRESALPRRGGVGPDADAADAPFTIWDAAFLAPPSQAALRRGAASEAAAAAQAGPGGREFHLIVLTTT